EGRSSDAAPALMQLAWLSAAALAIAPLQDVLNLGPEARMNVPGRAVGNWRWRCPEDMLSTLQIEWLRDFDKKFGSLWRISRLARLTEGTTGRVRMDPATTDPAPPAFRTSRLVRKGAVRLLHAAYRRTDGDSRRQQAGHL